MTPATLDHFREIWCVDFEFGADPGERPKPVCLVAREVLSGQTLRLWEDDLRRCQMPPYGVGPESVFVAYYASAELGCHLILGWPLPAYVLDLFAEFRCLTNGRTLPAGSGLLGALVAFGIDGIDVAEKEAMRALALRGGPWTAEEHTALLDYCESDVDALEHLLPAMGPYINLPRALIRGRYMKAAAHMEDVGIPIDMSSLAQLRTRWDAIKRYLIDVVDVDYHVYQDGSFRSELFEAWLIAQGMSWPRLPSGAVDLKDQTFRDMAQRYPAVEPLRQLRYSLSQMRLEELSVGSDGRNRCLLSAFRAKTGRNAPSTNRFIFGPAVWLRSLIRPEPGMGLAYVDWEQQEFGIAAALSGDPQMLDAYDSGDPYLAFAKQAKALPVDATKDTHGDVRELYKQCALAVQYGMGRDSLAVRIGQSPAVAAMLLQIHHELYAQFWRWSEAHLDMAALHGSTSTVFGWRLSTLGDSPRHNYLYIGAELTRLTLSVLA
jgi:DNA polymerase I